MFLSRDETEITQPKIQLFPNEMSSVANKLEGQRSNLGDRERHREPGKEKRLIRRAVRNMQERKDSVSSEYQRISGANSSDIIQLGLS